MTVKISCPSNKSEALVHHMGNIGLAKGTMAIEKITVVALAVVVSI